MTPVVSEPKRGETGSLCAKPGRHPAPRLPEGRRRRRAIEAAAFASAADFAEASLGFTWATAWAAANESRYNFHCLSPRRRRAREAAAVAPAAAAENLSDNAVEADATQAYAETPFGELAAEPDAWQMPDIFANGADPWSAPLSCHVCRC